MFTPTKWQVLAIDPQGRQHHSWENLLSLDAAAEQAKTVLTDHPRWEVYLIGPDGERFNAKPPPR